MSSAYLTFLIFLPAILIPACASSSLAFRMMYSAYKLNKQGDNIQLWHTPFPIWNQSIIPCLVLTIASWPAYRFHRRQVRWSGIPISLRIFSVFILLLDNTNTDVSTPATTPLYYEVWLFDLFVLLIYCLSHPSPLCSVLRLQTVFPYFAHWLPIVLFVGTQKGGKRYMERRKALLSTFQF